MLKKLIALMASAALCVFPMQALGVSDIASSSFPLPTTMEGYLTDDSGVVTPVTGYLVDTPNVMNASGENTATYEYTLYSTPSYSLTAEQADNSISVRAYLTIRYKVSEDSNGVSGYLLTNVSGYWERLDTGVRVKNASLNYGCDGVSLYPNSSTNRKVTKSNVSSSFNYDTGYSTYVLQNYGVVGANLSLTLDRWTDYSWTFTLVNNLFVG